ncbi:DNA-binding protein [Streptomyces sp. NPDC058316]|uniref:DNA-binding protein n=1 Tax=Streptomyces sp. NPDC058316 TaxID=3346442 RepID=UPI0036E311B7
MNGSKYELYGRPEAPADLNQEFMTVQETAFVLGCSVPTVRRRLQALGIKSTPGRRILTSKQDRLDIHNASRTEPRQRRRAGRRLPIAA